MRKIIHTVISLLVLTLITVKSIAGEIPNLDKAIDLNVREQPFVDFADAFFRQIEVPVVINQTIEGTVNGRFNGSAGDVLRDVATAFNIVTYYDGVVAYIYNASELSTRIIPANSEKSRAAEKLALSIGLPDTRNRITVVSSGLLVNGTARFIEQIEDLVGSIQAEVKPPAPLPRKPVPIVAVEPVVPAEPLPVYKVYKLKHAWASDTTFQMGGQSVTVQGVATLLKSLISEKAFAVNVADPTPGGGTIEGLRGKGLNASNSNQSGTSAATVPSALTSTGSEELIKIVADARLNAVIVRDTADRIPAYTSLIETLDVESQMVEIEATIIDINTDMSRELGVNWRLTSDGNDILFGAGAASDQALLPGSELITPQGRGGVLSLMLGEPSEFLARIQALEERGAARIVSKPHVVTLSDVEAVLGASTEFFVRIAGNQEVDLFNVPVGTFLRVTPHVFEDETGNRIKLMVNIEDGTQVGAQTVDSIPVIERANINTQAVINEGDSLLIGGLVREAYTKSDYRVPILGSLPGIGRLFRSDRNSSSRVERLFMITPRLAKGIGFGQTNNAPRLEGSTQSIVSDAGKRIQSVEWPAREKQVYWPDEVTNRQESQSLVETKGVALGMDGVAPLQVLSPFSVKSWRVKTGS